jgi:hypothetical protein
MDILKQIHIANEIINIDGEDDTPALAVFKMPESMDPLPEISDAFIHKKWLIKETPESIIEYYNDIINREYRIRAFNGVVINAINDSYYCDYCKTKIKDIKDYYYCYHCSNDMCKLCYEEVDEETAIKNGAKNFAKRAETLNECRSHGCLKHRSLYMNGPYVKVCDICELGINMDYYSRPDDETDTYDICIHCYNSDRENSKQEVEEHNMTLVKVDLDINKLPFMQSGFNSMMYWLPIVKDEDYNRILMNLNPDDENYRKIAFQSWDDHSRVGFGFVFDPQYTLEKVLTILKDIIDKGSYEYTELRLFKNEEGQVYTKPVTKTAEVGTRHHSSPIQILMQNLNLRVYFG